MSDLTKKALGASLKKILLQKPLEKITITDLTNDCGVNRQTFYYHFHDIYDLIDWIYLAEGEEAIGAQRSYDSWQDGLLSAFKIIEKEKHFILNTIHSRSQSHIMRMLEDAAEYLLLNVIRELSKNYNVSNETIHFMASFYRFSFAGVVFDWIENGMHENPQKIVDQVALLMQGTFSSALERFEKAKK